MQDKTGCFAACQPDRLTGAFGKGTGLGLAVVDGIVKKQNGFIKSFSKVGHGSKFQVFWPISE
ncbi:MAG: hypothetical protein PF503_09075 [Desulfobacula sp.]|nr:hypothetical protein [Desulfobacula sp.]